MAPLSEQEAELLAINLATRVLHGECTVDAGLVRAQGGGVLLSFVQNLNTLAGGDYFDFETLKTRVMEGVANRAMSGRADPLQLPEDLARLGTKESAPEADGPPLKHLLPDRTPVVEEAEEPIPEGENESFIETFREGLLNLDRKVKDLRMNRDELRRLLFFLERVQEKRTDPPRPWIGSVLILVISAIIGGTAFLVIGSATIPAVVMIGSVFLAVFLFQREYAWYERLMEIERTAQEHRARNMELHKRQIEEISHEIHEVKKEALLRLANLEGWEKEQGEKMRGDFPALFKD